METVNSELLNGFALKGVDIDLNSKLKLIFENSREAHWIADLEGNVIYISPPIEHLLGYTPKEFISTPFKDRMPSESADRLANLLRETIDGAKLGLFKQGTPGLGFEMLHRHKKGHIVWIETHISIMFGKTGEPAGIMGIMRDIDELKRYEIALKASEARYRAILSQIPDVIAIHRHGIILFISEAIYRLTGFKPQELVGKNIEELISPFEFNRFSNRKESVCEQHPFYESRLKTKCMDSRDIEIRTTVLEMESKLYNIIVITDITDRKLATESAQENERKYSDLVNLLPSGVFETDINFVPAYLNNRMYSLFGYQRNIDNFPDNLLDLFLPEYRDEALENINRVFLGEMIEPREFTCKRKNGSFFEMQMHISPILKSGIPAGFRGVMIDITDRTLRERELLKANKLEAISVLAGGIAHDFNNILTAIMGNLSLASIEEGLNKAAADFISEAERQIIRARDLTGRLMLVAKGGVTVRKDAPIAEIISDVVEFNLRGSKCTYTIRFGDNVPVTTIDSDSFGQIVTSLVINANQAMPDGGKIEIEVDGITIYPNDKNTNNSNKVINLNPGNYFCLTVKDQGCGIPSEYLDRIFDPYFSTKPGGSGLGLAVVQSIVEKNGGKIQVKSDLDIGSQFEIFLPAINHYPV